jgi:hypothetical protein
MVIWDFMKRKNTRWSENFSPGEVGFLVYELDVWNVGKDADVFLQNVYGEMMTCFRTLTG